MSIVRLKYFINYIDKWKDILINILEKLQRHRTLAALSILCDLKASTSLEQSVSMDAWVSFAQSTKSVFWPWYLLMILHIDYWWIFIKLKNFASIRLHDAFRISIWTWIWHYLLSDYKIMIDSMYISNENFVERNNHRVWWFSLHDNYHNFHHLHRIRIIILFQSLIYLNIKIFNYNFENGKRYFYNEKKYLSKELFFHCFLFEIQTISYSNIFSIV